MLIPIRVDVPMTRPWMNYVVIFVTTVISIAGFYDRDLFLRLAHFGTSCLLHAGWLHLLGNMLFLWVFGNAVNYKFGHIGYLILYAASALAGDAAHYLFSSGIAVGASGAIYGVMGAFLIYFPRNDIQMMLWLFFFFVRFFTLSSFWIILFWVGWDVLEFSLGIQGRVAVWAHLGGFALGFLAGLLCASRGWIKPEPDEQTLLQILGSGGGGAKRRPREY